MRRINIVSLLCLLSVFSIGLLLLARPIFALASFSLQLGTYDPNDPNDPNQPYDPNDPNEPYDPNDPNNILTGDISLDGIVNYFDFDILASYWLNSDCNVPDWCEGADFEHDGLADMNDLMIIAANWLSEFTIIVPDLTGMTQSDAVQAILAAGLSPGSASQEHSGVIAAGCVIRQSPAPGQYVKAAATVHLWISIGPTCFYVSKQGSDSANGYYPTPQGGVNGPFATIQKGLTVLALRDSPGDILSIRGGIYYEECTSFGGINAAGPVIIQNYGDEQVYLDGGEPITGWVICDANEPNLAVNGLMPPDWASSRTKIYKACVDVNAVYTAIDRPYYGVKLAYDGELKYPGSTMDMPYAVFPDLENYGWSMTSSTTTSLRDDVHLTQANDYWNGAFVWFIGSWDNVAYCQEILDFNAATHTITFEPCLAGVNRNKKYWIFNHPHYLNNPGEFYWDPNETKGHYVVYYYKTPQESPADLNAHMRVLSKSAGIRFSVSSGNLIIRGLHFRNYQTRGDMDFWGRTIEGGPIGECGFICCTNWCNSLSDITIEDCTFRNFYGNEGGAIAFGECEGNIMLRNCTISDVGRGAGIRLYGQTNDKIQGVTVANCTLSRVWGSNIRPYFAADVQITGNVITQFDGVHGNAVTVYGSCDNVLVAHNFVSGGTNAMVMKDMNNMYLFGNVFRCTDESGSVSIWDVDYRAVTGNLYILQNTILTSSPSQTRALFFLDQNNSFLPAGASVVVKNNIIDGFEYASDWNSVTFHDYNLYLERSSHQAGTCSNCAPWVYRSHEITNFNGHTSEFIDYFNEDYRIKSTSHAFRSGANLSSELSVIGQTFPSYNCQRDINAKAWSNPPSMGAFEY
ncbi:MAG: PASTA domain-containing protein [Planctomycetaceae bacterium]|nr:PASTA domain-containing protein [Planctomycetaceae bacterium]